MKTRFMIAVCVVAMTWSTTSSCFADQAAAVVADTVLVRPVCLVATALGAVFFVVSLPVAATSKTIKKTAHTLVVSPAQATFTRPLGDLDSLQYYSY
jgi:hypothetical protein